jgi:hypothetical protein
MAITLHYPFLTNPSLTGHDNEGLAVTTPDLSFTRATSAWDTDADGYIREYLSGEARFTGATFNNNRRINSATAPSASQEGGTAVDVTGSVTAPAELPAGIKVWELPDNNTDPATGTVRHFLDQNQIVLPTAGVQITISVYAKKKPGANVDWLYLNSTAITKVTGTTAYFDLANGVVGSGGTAGDGRGIVDAGNGWYRCWFTYTVTGADNVGQVVNIYSVASDGGVTGGQTLDGNTSKYVTGIMAEDVGGKASKAPTTFINTSGSAVTSLSGQSTKGLLLEEARTNICLQSEDFGTTWSPNANSSVSTNQTTAPDGATTADQLIDDSGGTGDVNVEVTQNVTVATATQYCLSVFAKADQLSWLGLRVANFTTPANALASFDIGTGVKGTIAAQFDDSGIEDYGNGWYRCWVAFTTDATDTTGTLRVRVLDGDADELVADDGTSSIYLWGAQLEAGAFPSSYIPTTTGSVTRNRDAIDNQSDVSWQETDVAGGFTLYAHLTLLGDTTEETVFDARDGDSSESMRMRLSAASGGAALFTASTQGGSAAGQTTDGGAGPTRTAGTVTRIAGALAQNDMAIYVDGTAGNTDSTVDVPGAFTEFNLCTTAGAGGDHANHHVAEIAYWNERLDNDTLDGLSAGTTTIQAAGGGVLDRKRRQHYRRQKLRAQGIPYKETWAGTYRGRRS